MGTGDSDVVEVTSVMYSANNEKNKKIFNVNDKTQ
jgi:hypothetical protein